MDKIIKTAFALSLMSTTAFAQNLSSLPAASTPYTGAELTYLVQNGQSRYGTVAQLVSFIGGPYCALSGCTMTGQINGTTAVYSSSVRASGLIANSLDTFSSGGTLTFGGTNATTLNIGNSGSTANMSGLVVLAPSVATPSSSYANLAVTPTITLSSPNSNPIRSVWGKTILQPGTNAWTGSRFTGVHGVAQIAGTTSLTISSSVVSGVAADVQNASTAGIISVGSDFLAEAPINTGSGSITNAWAVFQTPYANGATTATNGYGGYFSKPSMIDGTSLGTSAAPGAWLDIIGPDTSSSTAALRVRNSSGSIALQINDDLSMSMAGILNPSNMGKAVIYGSFYGIPTDGVTSADTAFSNALAACTAQSGTLILPAGKILLSGNVSQVLSNCQVVGAGGLSANTSAGTWIYLTNTSVSPGVFTAYHNWGIYGVNFYHPNQGVAAASFTASQTGTTMTVSSVTGTIANNQWIAPTTNSAMTFEQVSSGSGTTWTMSQSQSFSGLSMQATAIISYPPVITDTTSGMGPFHIERVGFVNCYDCIVQNATSAAGGSGWGDGFISHSMMYAVNRGIAVGNIGDTVHIDDVNFTPALWFGITSFSAASEAAVDYAASHAKRIDAIGNTVDLTIRGTNSEGWKTGLYVEPGVTVGSVNFDETYDGVGTIVDASSSGAAYVAQNSIKSASSNCSLANWPSNVVIPNNNNSCFVLSNTANSYLVLDGFYSAGANGSFVTTTGTSVTMRNVRIDGIGNVKDGGDYYLVAMSSATGATISSVNGFYGGNASTTNSQNAHVHGFSVTDGSTLGFLTMLENSFTYFNDGLSMITPNGVGNSIVGNKSYNTNASVFASLTGTNGIGYSNNSFDKPPAPTCAASGLTCTVAGSPNNMKITLGAGSAVSSFTMTQPFYLPWGSGGCTAYPNSGTAVPTTVGIGGATTTFSLSASVSNVVYWVQCNGSN
jgi:hypothetical protein